MDTIQAKRFLLLVHGHSYFLCRKYQASSSMREKRADALDRSFYSYFIVSFFFLFFLVHFSIVHTYARYYCVQRRSNILSSVSFLFVCSVIRRGSSILSSKRSHEYASVLVDRKRMVLRSLRYFTSTMPII